MNSHSK